MALRKFLFQSSELFHEEQEKAKKELAGELESIKLALQSQMLVLVSELDNAIQPGDDGKPKRFNKCTRPERITISRPTIPTLVATRPITMPRTKLISPGTGRLCHRARF